MRYLLVHPLINGMGNLLPCIFRMSYAMNFSTLLFRPFLCDTDGIFNANNDFISSINMFLTTAILL